MQFIPNGPDVPDALLQAHEENCVVFFCGSGISYPAGLPGFKGLVDKIYTCLNTTRHGYPEEELAYKKSQYDRTLYLLERRFPNGRIEVRKALSKALTVEQLTTDVTQTHRALLKLGRSRDGRLRLVTTNFDRIFEYVLEQNKITRQPYTAPALPVPKISRWDGLVYLHGLLPLNSDEDKFALEQLVVSSGDFGLAYLTEGWAARFVSELFRNFVVCFVGYSIHDLVLRYIMDALAADRMLGESTQEVYVFGKYESGQKDIELDNWRSINVLPILYQIHSDNDNHSNLHQTLIHWAEKYHHGIQGKEQVVIELAHVPPSKSTRQDDFVGHMLWALSDESGLPAKRFAELNPAPPIDWLMAFTENKFNCEDLIRFGVSSLLPKDKDLQFSFSSRPAPYQYASRMALVGNKQPSTWDAVMTHIAAWLVRHLNNPFLIYWLVDNGCQLDDQLCKVIEVKLNHYDKLHREGKDEEINHIKENSPNAIPCDEMKVLWRLLSGGNVKSTHNEFGLYEWIEKIEREGLRGPLRIELRQLLSPMIALNKPYPWGNENEDDKFSQRLRKIVDWELVLVSDDVQSIIPKWKDKEHWQDVLPELLADFQQLLLDALNFKRELDEADDQRDGSYLDLPSIEPHSQNRRWCDWVILIELLRDSWLSVRKDSPAKASRIAESWFELPYPTFKRLALFAASKDGCIDSTQWCNWLLSDDCFWLWSMETKREVMRLLVEQGQHLSSSQYALEAAILDGWSRNLYQLKHEFGNRKQILKCAVWLRLAKLNDSGLELGKAAQSRLNLLSSENLSWKFDDRESEEFNFSISTGWDSDSEENIQTNIAPREKSKLVDWLRPALHSSHQFYHKDDWRDLCQDDFSLCLGALTKLTEEGEWPAARWRAALHVWSAEFKLRQQSWNGAAPLLKSASNEILQNIAHSVAWWLDESSKTVEGNENTLIELCQRILNLQLDPSSSTVQVSEESTERPVNEAINHPVGLVTQALLNLCFRRKLNDDDDLPLDIKPLFTQMCNPQIEQFRYGRVLLGSRLIWLFRVDQSWTEQNLLPLFDWKNNEAEAKMVWEGYLCFARLFRPLLNTFFSQFIDTAKHYQCLCEYHRHYAHLLTHATLERSNSNEATQFRLALKNLPNEGLQEVARTLSDVLDSAGVQREECWVNRIQPLWQEIWPKEQDLVSRELAEPLALVCIYAGKKFSNAVELLHSWLLPIKYPQHVVSRLQESGLCAVFPRDALLLLEKIIREPKWLPSKLEQCLTDISQAMPDLENDNRYQQLKRIAT